MFEIYMPILDNLFCLWLLVVIAILLMEILHIAYLFVNDDMDYMKPCAYKIVEKLKKRYGVNVHLPCENSISLASYFFLWFIPVILGGLVAILLWPLTLVVVVTMVFLFNVRKTIRLKRSLIDSNERKSQ